MEKQVVKLKPEFRERIWGGEKIKTEFNGDTDIDPVGEMWVVAPFENNGDNEIEALNTTLSALYKQQPDWFKCDTPIVPIRCTIIDPLSNLSVQVHPQESYAQHHDQSMGKPEAWYIIDCKDDSTILFGHTAQSKEELKSMVLNKQWKELLSYIDAKKEGFLMVEAGDVHALGKDILCFEISRAADLTYRLYDYDRLDKKTGQLRELHIEKSLDVINVPHQGEGLIMGDVTVKDGHTLTTYIDAPGKFTMMKIKNDKVSEFDFDRFYFLTVIGGKGEVEGLSLAMGDTVLVPDGFGPITIKGDLELIVSSYRNEE
jgi:mannose-6-phosphate isomerase